MGVYDDDVILPKNDKITISHLDYYCIVFKDKHFLEGKIGNTCFGHEYKIPKGLTYYGYKGLGFLSPGEYKVPRIDVKGTYYVLGIYKTSFLITVYALFASIYYRVFLMKRR
ncbi:hypothetical protein [Leptospira koniambonensis]|uniref:hypothetical protein n=1 Tax=Leptospira koniambonensis TaxID=2484950 RepID=UPI003EBA4E76